MRLSKIFLLKMQGFVDDALKDIFDPRVVEWSGIFGAKSGEHLPLAVRVAQRSICVSLGRTDAEGDLRSAVQKPQQFSVYRVDLRARIADRTLIHLFNANMRRKNVQPTQR